MGLIAGKWRVINRRPGFELTLRYGPLLANAMPL